MSNKITTEKLIEDRRGIEALMKDCDGIPLEESDVCLTFYFSIMDQELTLFRNIINVYKHWASNLSNDNIIDVARSIENALTSEQARQQLLSYRVDHLRKLGVFQISEEELRKQKAERNLQRALAKRQQIEHQKEEALRKAATKVDSNDEISEVDDESLNSSRDENSP